MSTIRRRNVSPPPAGDAYSSSNTASEKLADEDRVRISLLDILRVLAGVVLLSSVLSYFITNNSLTWNYRPAWTRPAVLKAWLKYIRQHKLIYEYSQRGPLALTPEELALYNGTDPSLPIYLAINGTIYDVSASPTFYGPGGGYHFFAGRDATRAFVTGCFEEDLTPDLRGVDEMFMPVDDDDDDENKDDNTGKGKKEGKESKSELKKRREQDKRLARKNVIDAVSHWEGFFAKNDKYFKVGTVKREEGWLEKLPRRELCEAARKARPTRKPRA